MNVAARIYILRHRIEHVKEYNRDPSVEPMEVPTPRSMLAEPEPDKMQEAEGQMSQMIRPRQ